MDIENDDLLVLAAVSMSLEAETPKRKRKSNLERNRVGKSDIILQHYFHKSENDIIINRIRNGRTETVPIYGCLADNGAFERMNRMPQIVFENILQACRRRKFFDQTPDAAGLLGCSTEQKFIAGLRQITEGTSAFAQGEYCGLSETTALIALGELCESVVECFEKEFLRYPTRHEREGVEQSFRTLGFPGCIGAVDCSSWEWKSCPTAWHGEYKGREKRAVVKIEAWADCNLRIWSFYFGCSGSHNDLNILQTSPLFNSILDGTYDISSKEIKIADFDIQTHYFLADDIYPSCGIFTQTIPYNLRNDDFDNLYSTQQEAARKCVERLFGVLFARFHILASAARTWSRRKLVCLAKVCAIMHNMIVVERSRLGHIEALESSVHVEDGMVVLDDFGSLRRLRDPVILEEDIDGLVAVPSAAVCSKLHFSKLQYALKTHIAESWKK